MESAENGGGKDIFGTGVADRGEGKGTGCSYSLYLITAF